MIRRKSEQTVVEVAKPQQGKGVLVMRKIADGPEALNRKGRAFNHCFLAPGAGLGFHRHEDTTEILYILNGQGLYTDETGAITLLHPGDTATTGGGQGHSLFCTGETTLEFIALVLFAQ